MYLLEKIRSLILNNFDIFIHDFLTLNILSFYIYFYFHVFIYVSFLNVMFLICIFMNTYIVS